MRKRRVASLFLASTMMLTSLVGLAGCGDSKDTAGNGAVVKAQGKVYNVYVWNEEFKTRFQKYFIDAGKVPSDIKVNFVTIPNDNNGYQNALDNALLQQNDVADDDKVDLFCIEADYAKKYTDKSVTLDVKKDIGLTDDDLADQYKYTLDAVTDSNGAVKGVSWQATPGLFAYRRDIAKDVFGTDDPDEVQKQLADWSKFETAAGKMKDAGYYMLSGYNDSYRTFSNNAKTPWVDSNKKIQISDELMKWVDQTKKYTEAGYNHKVGKLFDADWTADMGPSSKVFGFFLSTWGIDFNLKAASLETSVANGGKEAVGNGTYGEWACCYGPQSYFWGGTWICAAAGSDNLELTKEVMKTLTCDKDTLLKITNNENDYTNTVSGMKERATSDYKSDFLGGQNHIKLFTESASKIELKNLTYYDQGLNESFQNMMKDYFDGNVSKDKALENFYTDALKKYPDLKK